MRKAVNQAGETIEANAEAPKKANCPFCGAVVHIRRRQLMGGTYIYFWRHCDNNNLNCSGRSKPI